MREISTQSLHDKLRDTDFTLLLPEDWSSIMSHKQGVEARRSSEEIGDCQVSTNTMNITEEYGTKKQNGPTTKLPHGVGWYIDLKPSPVRGSYVNCKPPRLVFDDDELSGNSPTENIGPFESSAATEPPAISQPDAPLSRLLIRRQARRVKQERYGVKPKKKSKAAIENDMKIATAREARLKEQLMSRQIQARRAAMSPEEVAADIVEWRHERKRRYLRNRQARLQENFGTEAESEKAIEKAEYDPTTSTNPSQAGTKILMPSDMSPEDRNRELELYSRTHFQSMITQSFGEFKHQPGFKREQKEAFGYISKRNQHDKKHTPSKFFKVEVTHGDDKSAGENEPSEADDTDDEISDVEFYGTDRVDDKISLNKLHAIESEEVTNSADREEQEEMGSEDNLAEIHQT